MTLRNRVAVAAAAGVLIVVAAVSSVLYISYAASLRSRVDATLVNAAQQATGIAGTIVKQAAARSQSDTDIQITVGGVEVQLFPNPAAGLPTQFGPLGGRDVAVAGQERPAYLSDARDAGQRYRVYTAAWLGNRGGLVRTSRPASADDGALRTAALLLELFLRNPGRVLSHAQIFQAVWGYDFGPRSGNLWVYIGYLRAKLEAAG